MKERNNRKQVVGQVVSAKMDKTVTVKVVRKMRHPQYGKVVERWKKYYAHNEKGDLKEGQTVKLMETRPISKLKRWRVIEVLESKTL